MGASFCLWNCGNPDRLTAEDAEDAEDGTVPNLLSSQPVGDSCNAVSETCNMKVEK